ncbi:aldo/keto reductase [Gilvibacter sediminis]|uniref:aldo/keto reductase n=1 Tax=Gilvibacter sediminis TaxID=379071 RepID=UPI002350B601|nr:aldo/keto reductase [Gilvibacter sediminis]MDC7997784.1 aldo/keto reductase [Gilvibacter sediminis]
MKNLKFRDNTSIPALGLGTWKSSPEVVKKAIIDAIELGYRHIDCAAIYQNEDVIGEAFQEAFDRGLVKREELFVTSKLWNDAHKGSDVRPALEKTLKDLRLDYLDLYLIHWPVAFQPGVTFPENPSQYASLDEIPLEETWSAMEAAKKDGLAKHIGVSNFSIPKLKRLMANAEEAPEMNQVEGHPLLQQPELHSFCKDNGILITAYSPLGSTDRSDAMKAEDEPNMFELPEIKAIADKHEVTPAQVLLGWHVNRGNTVIPKSTNKGRQAQNLAAAELSLSEEDMNTIAGLDRHFRYVNGKFFENQEKGYVNIYDD